MIDHDELQAMVARLVAQAEPGEQIDAMARTASTVEVLAYDGEVEKLTVADTAALGVRVIRDGRLGFASAGALDEAIALQTLIEARDNMPFAAPDPHVFIPEPDGAEPVLPEGFAWSDGVERMPLDDKVAMTIALERATRTGDPRISGVRNAGYGDTQSRTAYASSTGFHHRGWSTSSSISVSAMATDGSQTQTGGGFDAAHDPNDLDADQVAVDAIERSTRMLGAKQLASQRLTIVLEPRIAASIVGIIGGLLSGDRVYKQRTPFADRLGDAIAAGRFTLVDDATIEASHGARRRDGEGFAVRPTTLVDGGRLEAFLFDSCSASRMGATTTANAARGVRGTPGPSWHALHVSRGSGDLEAIIEGLDHGLLVHSMSGLHSGVNAISGDFSVGVEGVMIRNGALAEPIREATIASTLPRMLLDLTVVGADLEHRHNGVSTPTLAIADISLSGS